MRILKLRLSNLNSLTGGWELDFTEGDGDGRIEMSTMNGSLSICKD